MADSSEAVQKELSNNDTDWQPDGCSEAVGAAVAADVEDKPDSSLYAAGSEPAMATDEPGTHGWAENIAAAGGAEAGTSGWLENAFKNIDTNGDEWSASATADSSSLLSVDRHSQRFTASVVVNTANQERCKFIVICRDVDKKYRYSLYL